VPHISLVFREMWDTTAFDLRTLEPNKHIKLRFVVSHISRKTSEIWGTRGFVAEPNLAMGAVWRNPYPRAG
jgi:hypothetical protein